jgi:ubiquinone/menaquinone biosynthesis C-methylase UbiE
VGIDIVVLSPLLYRAPGLGKEIFMERVPEPELMDEDEQARAYSEADFAAPHERFVELFLASWPPARGAVGGIILDLGCGPADVTVRLARAAPGAEIHGIDGSAAMLRYGEERVRAAGLGDRIRLVRALLPRDRLPLERYEIVVSNSLLHHLHDPDALWSTIKRAAAPGAWVFVMDLMRPASLAEVDRLVAAHAAGEPEVLVRDFHASLCAAFSVEEIRGQLQRAGLPGLSVTVVSDRHLTVSGVV